MAKATSLGCLTTSRVRSAGRGFGGYHQLVQHFTHHLLEEVDEHVDALCRDDPAIQLMQPEMHIGRVILVVYPPWHVILGGLD
jgi:hypothetical protein